MLPATVATPTLAASSVAGGNLQASGLAARLGQGAGGSAGLAPPFGEVALRFDPFRGEDKGVLSSPVPKSTLQLAWMDRPCRELTSASIPFFTSTNNSRGLALDAAALVGDNGLEGASILAAPDIKELLDMASLLKMTYIPLTMMRTLKL
mmetsp:Transcript_22302/g.47473  ORF Transcript_22302/g.47473 Transcript_22302/m.47473 type:complete len:150 (-) Transcript_22302:991-1440(-)